MRLRPPPAPRRDIMTTASCLAPAASRLSPPSLSPYPVPVGTGSPLVPPGILSPPLREDSRGLELARRHSGAPDPVSACVEIIAADFLAGVPDLAALLPDGVDAPGSPDTAS